MTNFVVNSSQRTIQGAKTQITLCECSRCGYLWKPHRSDPAKCPGCSSRLWNKQRAYQKAGEKAPTRTPKPRGKPFQAGFDARRNGSNGSKKSTSAHTPETKHQKPNNLPDPA